MHYLNTWKHDYKLEINDTNELLILLVMIMATVLI
jgi:hypothetical protein